MPAILPRQSLPSALLQNSRLVPYSVGATLDALFLGVVITQCFTYYGFIRTDSKLVVAMVVFSVLATTGASLVILLWQQDIFVWGFGNLLSMVVSKWYLYLTPINIMTNLVVQMFYIDRSRKLYNHWWPVAVIAPFAVSSFGVQTAFVHIAYGRSKYLDINMFSNPIAIILANTYLSLTMITDILITLVVVYGLYRVRTGWRHTDRKIRQLIITVFEAQIPALAIAIVAFASWQTQDPLIMAFVFITSKVYVLGMLITLNLRGSPEASAAGANITVSSSSMAKQSHTNSFPMSGLPEFPKGGNASGHFGQRMANRKPSWENDKISTTSAEQGEALVMGGAEYKFASTEHLTPATRYVR